MLKTQKGKKRMGNKGFSLVELIVVIAIMAVLVGVLAPTLIGNIQKSKEAKDINALDSVYTAVQTALSDEKGNEIAMSNTYVDKFTEIDSLIVDTDEFTKIVKDNISQKPALSSKSAEGGDIYVKVTNDGKIGVVVAKDNRVLEAEKSKKAFYVGNLDSAIAKDTSILQ